jgi:hypothetical protein
MDVVEPNNPTADCNDEQDEPMDVDVKNGGNELESPQELKASHFLWQRPIHHAIHPCVLRASNSFSFLFLNMALT